MDRNTAPGLDVKTVKRNREGNKLYGIRDAELWSTCTTLIDFLDEIFLKEKGILEMMENPVGENNYDVDQ